MNSHPRWWRWFYLLALSSSGWCLTVNLEYRKPWLALINLYCIGSFTYVVLRLDELYHIDKKIAKLKQFVDLLKRKP